MKIYLFFILVLALFGVSLNVPTEKDDDLSKYTSPPFNPRYNFKKFINYLLISFFKA